jgi:hypothetical protein
MAKKPSRLTLVTQSAPTGDLPLPAALRETGAALWRSVTSDYVLSDPGSVETLYQACCAADRAADCAAAVERDGITVRTPSGLKEHPLVKVELTARSLTCRLLARLGLNLEPLRDGPGRPAGTPPYAS